MTCIYYIKHCNTATGTYAYTSVEGVNLDQA